jgi:hypothetical protein
MSIRLQNDDVDVLRLQERLLDGGQKFDDFLRPNQDARKPLFRFDLAASRLEGDYVLYQIVKFGMLLLE